MNLEWASEEMQGAELGDPRQVKSVIKITAALEEHPHISFSAACGPALRQAAHRIFAHHQTTLPGLLAGHFQATAARCAALPLVLIAQDTVAFTYKQQQITGLGPLNGSAQGLLGHGALALTPAGTPLGLLHLEIWGSDPDAPPPQEPQEEAAPRAREERESYKWYEGLHSTARWLPAGTRGLLLQDREADIFGFLAEPRPAHLELLVRARVSRAVAAVGPALWLRALLPDGDTAPWECVASTATAAPLLLVPQAPLGLRPEPPTPAGAGAVAEAERAGARACRGHGHLFAVAAAAPVLGRLRVTVPRQSARGAQAAVPGRAADLEVRAVEVEIPRPQHEPARSGLPATVRLWVIYAEEVSEPEHGEARVRWILLTTLPVPDGATACRLVGYYARRWVIERLHYTLKSGLGAERLQFDDAVSLGRALGLYYVVAVRLLQLTYVARHAPERPAAEFLEAAELAVLAAKEGQAVPTIGEAVQVIAKLGGYQPYRNAPPPGVKVLWLGLQRLHGMAEGWLLAHGLRTYEP